MGFLISSILLIAFSVLAIIDGFYLHLLKYKLYLHNESKLEHLTHTLRAILFPFILYFLFVIQNQLWSFYLGLSLVALDILILGLDAFLEKDSRKFMGGLPQWEYILHLFVNGFHFASIAVFLAIKLNIKDHEIQIISDLSHFQNFKLFTSISINLIPGAIILAVTHVICAFSKRHKNCLFNNLHFKCC